MQSAKRWNIAPPHPKAAELASGLKTSPLIAQFLLNRGISELAECRKFLSPSLKDLHEPSKLPNLTKAAERIARAIRDGQKTVIYGDYDVDGITGTAILWHAIRLLGGQVEYYIPHRVDEGYGLNSDAVGQICDEGAKLIVTVDCGVTAVEQARVAAQRGVDLIITDHHDWKQDRRPECHSVVHPRLAEEGVEAYGNPHLCGAGVAFKLAWGIGQAHSGNARVKPEFRSFLVEATGLAALGTIADVVPLIGENRLLAHFGLGGLKRSELTGIKALIASAGLSGRNLDSYHVGFLLAPRLNACGRMGHARAAVEMLTSADAARAGEIATELEQQNRDRQALEKKIFEEAMEQVASLGLDGDDCRGVVLGAEGWHAGVIGIVASRVVGRLNRPTIMVALTNGEGHGSGRSIPGFHLARALAACGEHLSASGGHEMAAGLRLERAKFEAFRQAFNEYARGLVSREMLTPTLRIDCVAELRQLNEAMVRDMARLGPFGTANPRPLVCCMGLEVVGAPRRVGKNGEHVQFLARQNGVTLKCIAFKQGEVSDRLSTGVKIDAAVEPTIDEYNGYRSVQLEVKDLRFAL